MARRRPWMRDLVVRNLEDCQQGSRLPRALYFTSAPEARGLFLITQEAEAEEFIAALLAILEGLKSQIKQTSEGN